MSSLRKFYSAIFYKKLIHFFAIYMHGNLISDKKGTQNIYLEYELNSTIRKIHKYKASLYLHMSCHNKQSLPIFE